MPSKPGLVSGMEIVSTRVFSATPETVFRAISEPEHLQVWWGPKDFTNTFEEFDFRPGGRWKFVMHGPNGAHYPNEHQFLEIAPPGRVVLQHITQPRFKMTMILEEEDGKTRLVWKMLFESERQFAAAERICPEANEQNFDRLEAELKRMQSR